MARSYIATPDGAKLDSEQLTIAGVVAERQSVEACPPRFMLDKVLTRAATVTAYTAGDAVTDSETVPTVMTFANAARFNGGGGLIRSAIMVDSVNAGTKGNFELWLFNSASPGPVPDNDNVAFTPTDAELQKLVAIITFHSVNAYVGDAASNAAYLGSLSVSAGASMNLDIPYTCDPTLKDLYGLLVVRNAYTPVSAEQFAFRLQLERE